MKTQSLSPREVEVLALVAEGRSTSEIASDLSLSAATVKTVKTHLQRSFGKLKVNERGGAVAEAMRRGLID